MHRNPAAISRSNLTWSGRLQGAVLCLGCLLAGAALVTMASPLNWLSADSASQNSDNTVLLDFTASWCGPCREMSPIVERLAQQGYPIRKVDVDQQRNVAEFYKITSMPTFVLVVNGREVMRQSGVTSEAQLRRMLLQIPAWKQELANQAAAQAPQARPLARTSPPAQPDADFGVSPFSIDLGSPQTAPPAAPVATAAPPRRNSILAPFTRSRNEPAAVAMNEAAPPVVRGQSTESAGTNPEPVSGDPLLATTRLRVKDSAGMNFGTGTILESRVGRTLILTCGHIFRHLGENGLVEVDVFVRGDKPITYVGKVVQFNEESDVGLVAIPTTERLPVMPLAALDAPLQVGDSVLSIGCGGGETPGRETVEVTSLNKYTGPDNIECTGFPVPGRSGGGLFRGKELVGVCIAADPKDRRGVYTGLSPVYELLEKSGFGHLLPVGRPAFAPNVPAAPQFAGNEAAQEASPFGTPGPDAFGDEPRSNSGSPVADMAAAEVLAGAAAGAIPDTKLQQVLEQAPDSEVICIVRPRNPGVPSRVVIIHQASPKLVGYLLDSTGELPAALQARNDPKSRPGSLIPTTAMTTGAMNPGAMASGAIPATPVNATASLDDFPFDSAPLNRSNTLPAPTRPSSPRSPFQD